MNIVDLDRTPVHDVVDRVRRDARARGVEVIGGELIGLVPERVLDAAFAAGIDLPGVDERRVLERVLRL
jgi:glutamate formiminotransferase